MGPIPVENDVHAVPRLRAVDLNLLPILRQLLTDKSVTKAAHALALSQPAVSKALGRLRAIFDDRLLVRDGGGMRLTPWAERLRPQVEEQCQKLEDLWKSDEFVPESSRRDFKISASDYEILLILPKVSSEFQKLSPFISLSFCDVAADFSPNSWSDVDFIIGPDEMLASMQSVDLVKIPLITEDFVTVVRTETAGDDFLRKDAASRKLAFSPGQSLRTLEKKMLPFLPEERLATIHNFTLLPILAVLTGSSAIVPRVVATRFSEFLPITIIDDQKPDTVLNISIAWHRRWEDDSGHRWLRELIKRCFQP